MYTCGRRRAHSLKAASPRMSMTVIAVAGGLCLWATASFGQEEIPGADRAWRQILAVMETEVPEKMSATETDAYWKTISLQCRDSFWKMASVDKSGQQIERFVNRFGQHGAKADLGWFLAFSEGMIAWQGTGALYDPEPGYRYRDLFLQRRRVQLAIAKAQVGLFIREPALLKRYARLVLWSNCLGGDKGGYWLQSVVPAIASDETYYWGTRNAMVMIQLTGRKDLLENARPETLKSIIKQWFEWMASNGGYLSYEPELEGWRVSAVLKASLLGYVPYFENMSLSPFSAVEFPFDDWEKTVLPPPRFFEQIDE